MAAAPDNGLLRPPGPPPLGAILVRRGLLTEPQLEAALAESKRTGEPTGEVIVRLGFASAATIAQALATQHGGPLKTEYGYAVGFGGDAPAVTAAAAARPAAPPVSPVPAQDERPAAPAPASAAVRAAPPVEPVLSPAPPPAAPAPAAAPPQPDPVLLQWQQHAQQLAAHRDAALRELEATKASLAELEVAAAVRDTDLAAQKELERASTDAEARNAELERELAELRASAAADDGHLAAATARVAELESSTARDAELEAELTRAREEAARIQMEKVALEAAHESMAAHTADLEEKLKALEATTARTAELERQLEEVTAQMAQLEAERTDVLAVAKAVGEEKRGLQPDEDADDPAHLLFVPGREGYRLVEQDGPPPAAGSTVELAEDDGTTSTLVVTKVGPSPLPGTRLACAYLVTAA
jgi:hypothetical protein